MKGKGRAVVRDDGLHGSVMFFVREIPESVRGPSSEAFREYRRERDVVGRNELRRMVKEMIVGVRFRADIDFSKAGWLSFVRDSIEFFRVGQVMRRQAPSAALRRERAHVVDRESRLRLSPASPSFSSRGIAEGEHARSLP